MAASASSGLYDSATPEVLLFQGGFFLGGVIGVGRVQLQQCAAGAAVHLLAEHAKLSGVAIPRFLLRQRPDAVPGC